MAKSKSKEQFFLLAYAKAFFEGPKTFITHKQWISTIFGRITEIPMIGVMWLSSKISPRFESIVAHKIAKKWNFKPIPNQASLSNKALQFKKEKTIEINNKIDVQTKILDITTFNEIAERFPFSLVAECGCRSVIMQCDSPKHTCLSMQWATDSSKIIQNNSKFQQTTPEEIKEVIDLADKWALVHMTLNYPDNNHTYVVCNCCDCCCVSFREFKAHATPIIVGSKYVAKIDSTKCIGCYHCINYRCRFRAILKVNEDGTIIDPRKEDRELFKYKWPLWSQSRNGWGTRIRKDPPSWEKVKSQHPGKWYSKVDPNRCFGCGNCASPKYGCPEWAILLYPREK